MRISGSCGPRFLGAIQSAGQAIHGLAQLRDLLAGAGQHFHHQGRSEDAVFPQNVAANGESAGRFASQQRIVFHHSFDDVLEAYRDFIALLVQGMRKPVEQVGG